MRGRVVSFIKDKLILISYGKEEKVLRLQKD